MNISNVTCARFNLFQASGLLARCALGLIFVKLALTRAHPGMIKSTARFTPSSRERSPNWQVDCPFIDCDVAGVIHSLLSGIVFRAPNVKISTYVRHTSHRSYLILTHLVGQKCLFLKKEPRSHHSEHKMQIFIEENVSQEETSSRWYVPLSLSLEAIAHSSFQCGMQYESYSRGQVPM